MRSVVVWAAETDGNGFCMDSQVSQLIHLDRVLFIFLPCGPHLPVYFKCSRSCKVHSCEFSITIIYVMTMKAMYQLMPWTPGMPCQSYLESQPTLKLLIALHQDTWDYDTRQTQVELQNHVQAMQCWIYQTTEWNFQKVARYRGNYDGQ